MNQDHEDFDFDFAEKIFKIIKWVVAFIIGFLGGTLIFKFL